MGADEAGIAGRGRTEQENSIPGGLLTRRPTVISHITHQTLLLQGRLLFKQTHVFSDSVIILTTPNQ